MRFITASSRCSAANLVPCFEIPARADYVLQELKKRNLGPVEGPDAFDDAAIARIHAPRYLDFLANAWSEWVALDPANAARDALPSYWPIRTFRSDVLPASFPARMGCSLTTRAHRSPPVRGRPRVRAPVAH